MSKLYIFICNLLRDFGTNETSVISGGDLHCSYSADFGSDVRVEWKFQDLKGTQSYVIYNGKPTGE